MVSHLREYKGKKIVDIAKGDVDVEKLSSKEDAALKEKAKEAKDLLKRMQGVLGESVEEVRVSGRLVESQLPGGQRGRHGHSNAKILEASDIDAGGKPILR